MRNLTLTCLLLAFVVIVNGQTNDYTGYHKNVIHCEQLISEKKIDEARQSLDSLFTQFDFVFLREYKLATELSLYEHDYESAFKFLRLGMLNGWSINQIKKTKNLKRLLKDPRWEVLAKEYDSIRETYWSNLNMPLKAKTQKMIKVDQKIALSVFIRIGEKNRLKHAERKFAPHSKKQLFTLDSMLNQQGYPGEQLIGNSFWGSVILSHHNSFSPDYILKDTLYNHLRPKLMKALKRGELSPYEFAQMEDWKAAVLNGYDLTSFGFIGKIMNNKALETVNKNRSQIGLRSIELRNKLLDVEEETGMNLYLPKDWQKGEIIVDNK